ncbi:MAG: pilus assembly protein PilY [Candidatus Competibacteraceae bacterium]|nr:pilus assembly protein PilY [Candidatus Competibacteraceae bacterium]
MNNLHFYAMHRAKSILAIIVALVFISAGNIARSAISQLPLFMTTAGVDPNIMFILDDSGSMQWEHMPDQTMYFTTYVFPRPSSIYGGSTYTSQVPDFNDANIHNTFSRSSDNNAVFYNPLITYKPWVNADNTPYANASPTAAPYNPADLTRGTLNLTAQQTQSAYWFRNTSNTNQNSASYTCGPPCNQTFWPITFYRYKGTGGRSSPASYIKYQIRGGNGYTKDLDGGAETAVTSFTWSDGTQIITRTVLEERQNFANWFTYYRSRILAARAGIGRAFGQQPQNMRVGFGAINVLGNSIDGVYSDFALVAGVRPFSGSSRSDFFDNLYGHVINNSYTPLRRALNAVGQYYSRTDNRGPWGKIPGTDDGSDHLTCRQSYTILMTDGFWNGPDPAVGNADNTAGSVITDPNGASYQYQPADPYRDNWSNTLADVAMYYWQRDLRSTLDNSVPANSKDEAFWQHMVTFGIGLGVDGSINPQVAWDAVQTGSSVAWLDPTASNPAKLDDLLHAAINGRGDFFSAADPDTFANELAGVLEDIVTREESSAASLATNSTKLDTGTSIFQATFNSSDWTGQLISYALDPTYGTVGAANWDTSSAGKIPAAGSRTIYGMIGSAKVEFKWSALTAAQQTTLDGLGITEEVLNWVRGDQSQEMQNGGTLRNRRIVTEDKNGNPLPPADQYSKLLGDIVNSDPAYVGKPVVNFKHSAWDSTGYGAFLDANQGRTPMLYVGANDGMLHAFNALTDPTTGGVEQFAFIPNAALANLASLSAPNYSHKYFVDGSPIISDAKIGGNWKSVLIGTTGAGGRAVFALDVTNPDSFTANNVLWEINADDTEKDLGYTIGQPTIGRIGDEWFAIFGNGYESDNGKAVLFIVPLDDPTNYRKITTNNETGNGLATPALIADEDGSLIAAYAGDLQGNLWKFDLTSETVAFSNNPLFKARDGSGNIQPITAPLEIAEHPSGGYLIFFGTGKYFETGDHAASATPVHSLYGIWDTAKFEAGAWIGGTAITATDRSVLLEQEILGEGVQDGNNWRLLSKNPITWNSATMRGWYVDLVVNSNPKGERVIDAPILFQGRVIFVTRITYNIDPCIPSTGTSWFMALDWLTGGQAETNVFDVNRDNESDTSDYVTIAGVTGVASGFQTEVAGIAQATLIRSAGGVDILASGTGSLSSSASGSAIAAANAAAAAAAAAATQQQAAADAAADAANAQTAASDAQAAADADPTDANLTQAAVAAAQALADAQAEQAAAAQAAADANTAAAAAIVNAANEVINNANAIISGGGNESVTVAVAGDVKNQASAIIGLVNALAQGAAVDPTLAPTLAQLARQLSGGQGASMQTVASRQSWQQLQ